MKNRLPFTLLCLVLAAGPRLYATEIHVAVSGNDANTGSAEKPLKTIQAAANLAQAGDVITVHAGIYRERVNPPRGGTSDTQRITYQAAAGEKVIITGSEPAKGWTKVSGDTWKVTLANSYFGDFNPYSDLIHGDWFRDNGREHHTGSVYVNGDWLIEAAKLEEVIKPAGKTRRWYGQVKGDSTTIWAQFPGVNPNEGPVEINVRKTVFTPEKTGINYITVRGFTLRNAATNWAPPTAGQIGLVTAYWCRGWIIENNDIAYSRCSGVSLGKYSDEWDNKAGSAKGYVGTIDRALAKGWNKQTLGGHLVRNNHIHHCEQAGIVGSLGCSFSTVAGNEIHDIQAQAIFGGAEMAGVKFHGAIDVVISNNHIYRCGNVAGIWLDWMGQGAQITGNLLHDNTGRHGDLWFEMQHGPLLVANNLLLSPKRAITLDSKGIAIAHNLIAGSMTNTNFDARNTPFHPAHSTAIAGLYNAPGGDHRFYNNLFLSPSNLHVIDKCPLPNFAAGNVYTKGAQPSRFDIAPLVKGDFDPEMKLEQKADGWYLTLTLDHGWGREAQCKRVTTDALGKAKIPNLPYENADGSPLKIDSDYFGKKRNEENPFPGPFEITRDGRQEFKVWSK